MKDTTLSKNTERLGTAPIGRLLLALSLPGMASMVTMALYNIIDTFWVARLGHEAIAALTVVLPFFILVIAISVGTGIGINALVSRRFGEGNVEVTNKVAGQMFPITAGFGLFFIAAAVLFHQRILGIVGATPDIMVFATQYLVIVSLGAPFIIFSIASNNLLRGSGEAVMPMVFMIAGSVLNIVLDPFLIFGIGPFPELQIRGAAIATVISQGLGAVLSLVYIMFTSRSAYRIHPHHLKPDWPIIKDIYRVGLPAVIMDISESVVFALYNNALSVYGSVALAAGGLAFRITDLVLMPIFGTSGGLLPIVGYCLGAGLWKRLWKSVTIASLALAALMGAGMLVMEIAAPAIVKLFSREERLALEAVPAIRIIISSLVFVGPTVLGVTTFQGLSKGRDALVLASARQFVFFLPLLFFLPRMLGLTGIWIALPASDFFGFLVTIGWLLREYRKNRQWSESLPA